MVDMTGLSVGVWGLVVLLTSCQHQGKVLLFLVDFPSDDCVLIGYMY
jgi:hypothetical protein